MRCLTLADYLKGEGAEVSFVCRELAGHMGRQIEVRGFAIRWLEPVKGGHSTPKDNDDYAAWLGVSLEQDARETYRLIESDDRGVDWLIVDHYALNAEWHRSFRPLVGNIMVIDDLADRQYECDVLLDQNSAGDESDQYRSLVPSGCRCLLGPRYALLRAEFAEARRVPRTSGRVRRIFVFMGGVDRSDVTAMVIEALAALPKRDFEAQVVVGGSNTHRHELAKTCSSLSNIIYCEQVNDMAARMASADLAVGAGGTTTWERCAVGLPSLVISVAENQVSIAREVEQLGIGKYLGSAEDVTVAQIMDEIERLQENPEMLLSMRQKAQDLVDGKGVERVGQVLLEWSRSGG